MTAMTTHCVVMNPVWSLTSAILKSRHSATCFAFLSFRVPVIYVLECMSCNPLLRLCEGTASAVGVSASYQTYIGTDSRLLHESHTTCGLMKLSPIDII